MKKENIKAIGLFIGSALLFAVIIALNFFAQTIAVSAAEYHITLPWYTIPSLSFIILLFISFRFSQQLFENTTLKHDFVTIVTHKFRTPITGMKWALDNLKEENLVQQERIDILHRMEQSIDRLLEIVDIMVGASKFDRRIGYVYERTSIRAMVEESIAKYSEMIRKKNITLQINPAHNLPHIIIDKRKLQFAVDILLENAIKYTPAGEKITVDFLQNDPKIITLKIQDHGIGFGFFERRRLFTQFYRGTEARHIDTEGMGLGLYTAKQIVTAHGGKLWAESKGKNKGATFYMELKAEI